jgi:Ppx/GppA phosphatase family protein
MRIAAIDLGSNSFHMVIVESRSGSFHVVDREKEMIRLGERTLSPGRLSAASMKRGLDTLGEYKRLAARRPVRVLAGLLRLADALDRSHRRVMKSLAVTEPGERLRLRCEISGDAGLDQWAAARAARA